MYHTGLALGLNRRQSIKVNSGGCKTYCICYIIIMLYLFYRILICCIVLYLSYCIWQWWVQICLLMQNSAKLMQNTVADWRTTHCHTLLSWTCIVLLFAGWSIICICFCVGSIVDSVFVNGKLVYFLILQQSVFVLLWCKNQPQTGATPPSVTNKWLPLLLFSSSISKYLPS